MPSMKARECGGHVGRAPEIRVFVAYSGAKDGGCYLPITRVQARAILNDAKEKGITDVDVTVTSKGVVLIGDELDLDAASAAEEDGPGPICSACEEPWEDDHECPR